MDVDYFRLFARYNRWANRRLYDAVARLPPAEYLKPRPAFFKSIHGVLNHGIVTDRLWLGRIVGKPVSYKLDQILYGDLVALRVAREAEDERIVTVVDGVDDRQLASELAYRSATGNVPYVTPMKWVLGHFFNHQTHHRGQAHDLLSQTEVAPPELDFIYFQREVEKAKAAA